MKTRLSQLMLALVFISLAGCRKGDDAIENNSLQGLWELRRGIGMITVDYPPGNGTTIRFNGNNYEYTVNGQVDKGEFEIVKDLSVQEATCLSIPQGEYTERIIYKSMSSDRKIFFKISGTRLTFVSGCFAYDAGSFSEYVKVGE
jgi:hypothetical protein